MSIFKAVLLTLLITSIEYSIQAIILIGFDVSGLSYDFEHLYGITIIICRIIAYSTVFYLFWSKNLFSKKIKLLDYRPKILIYLVVMTLGLRMVGEPFWDFNQIFRSAEITFYSFDGIDTIFVYRSITILVIAPILEELFFRKFLISKLIRKYSKPTTLFVSAILFSAIHWETLNNLLPSFIFGIIGGIVFLRTKKVSYLILLHFLYNFLSLSINFNSKMYFDFIQWLNYGILYWFLFVSGILITLFALKQIPSEARHEQ